MGTAGAYVNEESIGNSMLSVGLGTAAGMATAAPPATVISGNVGQ